MRKKMLFLITKSNFGGAQRYVFDLATHLSKDEFDVAVAFGQGGGPVRERTVSNGAGGKPGRLAKMLSESGMHTIFIPELDRDISLRSDWKSFSSLLGMFKAEKPDIVHLNSSKAGGLGALAARLSGVPRIIFTIHGLPSDENRSVLQKWIIGLLTWLTILLSHRTIAITSDILERVREYPLCYRKVSLIYSGIAPIDFRAKTDARRELRSIDPTIPEDGFLVGTVAELHPNKDIETAIDAIALLPDIHFTIIGDGECREKLREYAREKAEKRVHFLGFIGDTARYLRAFDAFLLTSIKEGLPYVLLEAGSAGVPIVASEIPGVREIVLPDFTGLLAPMRDGARFAGQLQKIQINPPLVTSLTNEMSTRIQKTFSLARMIEKTIGLYTA